MRLSWLSGLCRLCLLLRRRARGTLLVGSAAAIASITTISTLTALLLAVAAILLEARLLLAIAVLVAPAIAATVASAITAAVAPAIASAATAAVAPMLMALLVASRLALLRGGLRGRCRDRRLGRRRGEQAAEDAAQETDADGGRGRLRRCGHRLHGGLRRWPRRLGLRSGRRLVRRDALDHRLLALELRRFLLGAGRLGLFGALDQLVAGGHVLHRVQLVVLEALHLVVRRLEVRVGHQHDVDLEARLELLDLGALLVQQERCDVDRHLRVHRAGVLLHRLFLDDPQHVQRGRFGAADEAGAAAARAADVRGLLERGLQALARELHQAEARDLADLHPGAVELERVAQAVLHLALVALRLHVDEVDDDQAAEVAQAQLARDFLRRLEVGAERGFLDVAATRGTRRVDVDRGQGFCMVDDDRAARRQRDLARVGALDLVLDLEAGKERNVIAVELHLSDVARHHRLHERLRLLEDLVGVDQDLADVGLEVVADRADHQARLEVDQERLLRLVRRRAFHRAPELHQVVQVPVQLLQRAPDRRGARDHAHAVGELQLVERIAQLVAVLALDAARHAAAARIVRHEHQISSCQADKRRQGGALGAALVLLDLDDDLLAFAQRVLDAGAADVDAFLEVTAGDFLERQEPVPLLAVVDERGLEAGLDAGDEAFVDVALALLP